MGLFNMFKKDNKTVDTNNQIVEEYSTPVEEIDAPLPVGNLEAIKEEKETPVLVFEEVSKPANASNMYKEIAGNQCIVNGNSTVQEFGHLFNTANALEESVAGPMPTVIGPIPTVIGPMPIINEPEPTVVGQVDNGLDEIQPSSNLTDDNERENRFFIGEVEKSEIYKKKEEVSPINASTDIFNIGKIPTSNDEEYGFGRTR